MFERAALRKVDLVPELPEGVTVTSTPAFKQAGRSRRETFDSMTWRTIQVDYDELSILVSRIRSSGGTVVRCCPDHHGEVAVTYTKAP